MKILIIDDDRFLRVLLKKMLVSYSHEVDEAKTGEEGYKKIMTNNYDLAFLDWHLPEMSGIDVLNKLIEAFNKTPVALMTAHESLKVSVSAFRLGIINFILKPYSEHDINETITISKRLNIQRKNSEIAIEALIKIKSLKKQDELKNAFISVIAHEFNTPLTPIDGFTSLAISALDKKDYSDLHEYLNYIKKSSGRLQELIINILNYVQIITGKVELNRQIISISDLVEINIDRFKKKHVEINIQKTPNVYADESLVLQIIDHIFSNALKFCEDKIILNVFFKDKVKIEIIDNGKGIDAESLSKVFLSFTQIDRFKSEQQGVGLGLTIAKSLAKIQNGDIEITSKVGEGTKVTIIFQKIKKEKNEKNSNS